MKKSSKIFSHGLAFLVVLCMMFQVMSVFADSPQAPQNFYGSLTINGEPASDGREIQAWIGTEDRTDEPPYETDTAGEYGSNQFGGNKLQVTGTTGDMGTDNVIFMVETTPTSNYFVEANERGSFNPGANTLLDLTVETQLCDELLTSEDCSANVLCEWCAQCDGSYWSSAVDSCVDVGSCTHDTCSVAECSAGCDDSNPCADTLCAGNNGCYDNIYRTYSDVANTCETCSCSSNECTVFTAEGDPDGDGYSASCEDCAPEDGDIFPGNPETCDDKDNDCDGQTDETYPDKGNACSVGTGACETIGNLICNGAGTGVECSATAGTPGVEICDDGIDNDCDGTIDYLDPSCQDCTQGDDPQPCDLQSGVCSGSVRTCDEGFWTGCDAAGYLAHSYQYETNEFTCNDQADNDCDGLTDCEDPSCSTNPICIPESACNDQADNDLDGLTDCDDPDCSADPVCNAPEYCIVVGEMRLLDHEDNPVTTIAPGAWFKVEVPNTNVCFGDLDVKQIIQVIDSAVTPIGGISAVTGPILASQTVTYTAEFEMTGGAGAYTAQAFNWNDWSSAPGWEELSLPGELAFTVA